MTSAPFMAWHVKLRGSTTFMPSEVSWLFLRLTDVGSITAVSVELRLHCSAAPAFRRCFYTRCELCMWRRNYIWCHTVEDIPTIFLPETGKLWFLLLGGLLVVKLTLFQELLHLKQTLENWLNRCWKTILKDRPATPQVPELVPWAGGLRNTKIYPM